MKVFKFGGASVKNAYGVRNLARIVKAHTAGDTFIVVSAIDKTTNALEELTRLYTVRDQRAEACFDQIKHFHRNLVSQLFDDIKDPIHDQLENDFVEITWVLEEDPHDHYDFVYDQIVSMGEIISSRIVSAYLNKEGIVNQWVDIRGYIQTDNSYRKGIVDMPKTAYLLHRDFGGSEAPGLFVTQGFIGGTSENFTTTLGREGSDFSGAIVAGCLGATSLTVWKDVPGILTADPKYFPSPEIISELSYEDAEKFSTYGATVIHPKTIQPLKDKNIPLWVKSFTHDGAPGTRITNVPSVLLPPVYILKRNQAVITMRNLAEVPNTFQEMDLNVTLWTQDLYATFVAVDWKENLLEIIERQYAATALEVVYDCEILTVFNPNGGERALDYLQPDRQLILEVIRPDVLQWVTRPL